MNVEQIKVGDRIKFRAVTRWSGRSVWRKVVATSFMGGTHIQVRYEGHATFFVRDHEITEVEAAT